MAFGTTLANFDASGQQLPSTSGKLNPRTLYNNFGVGQLGLDTQSLYTMLLNSPSFRDFMNRANITGSIASNNINANLARAGLTGTGTGAIQGGLGSAVAGSLSSQGRSALWDQAFQASLQDLMGRLSAFSNYQTAKAGQPSTFGQIAGSLIGAGGYAAGAALGKH